MSVDHITTKNKCRLFMRPEPVCPPSLPAVRESPVDDCNFHGLHVVGHRHTPVIHVKPLEVGKHRQRRLGRTAFFRQRRLKGRAD